ncbi:hypothetical protein BDF14DRAFT_1801896 [Spinellus fusiger]|nr:hypothetical protein BDF14DRAFT_1801896 [Spinellus fusiger]
MQFITIHYYHTPTLFQFENSCLVNEQPFRSFYFYFLHFLIVILYHFALPFYSLLFIYFQCVPIHNRPIM